MNQAPLFKGLEVNIDMVPVVAEIPSEVAWEEFSEVKHMKKSAAYDIFTANWRGEQVVVKRVLEDTDGPRSGAPKEINKEIKILNRLNHPNIIKVLGSGFYPNRFAILEYMGGGTLSKKLNYTYHDHPSYGKYKLPQRLCLEYATKIADALAYIHERWHPGIRLMHRDLKSDNIAFTASGEIKLIDFGMYQLMRKTVQEDVFFGLHGGVGSWRYMAPEVVLLHPYNHKIDVYSYTIIFYHMLTGRHPVPLEMNRTVHKEYFIRHNWRPRIHPYWPTRIYQIIVRGWSPEARVRPNFNDIVRDLKEATALNIDFDMPLLGGAKYGLIDFVQ